jgi:hypothetical protein
MIDASLPSQQLIYAILYSLFMSYFTYNYSMHCSVWKREYEHEKVKHPDRSRDAQRSGPRKSS